MNIHLQVFVWTHVFGSFAYLPGSGIVGSHDNSIFDLLRNIQAMFRHSGCTIYITLAPTSSVGGVPRCSNMFLISCQHLIIMRVRLLKMNSQLPLEKSDWASWGSGTSVQALLVPSGAAHPPGAWPGFWFTLQAPTGMCVQISCPCFPSCPPSSLPKPAPLDDLVQILSAPGNLPLGRLWGLLPLNSFSACLCAPSCPIVFSFFIHLLYFT